MKSEVLKKLLEDQNLPADERTNILAELERRSRPTPPRRGGVTTCKLARTAHRGAKTRLSFRAWAREQTFHNPTLALVQKSQRRARGA